VAALACAHHIAVAWPILALCSVFSDCMVHTSSISGHYTLNGFVCIPAFQLTGKQCMIVCSIFIPYVLTVYWWI
jgi:hypothetical protein